MTNQKIIEEKNVVLAFCAFSCESLSAISVKVMRKLLIVMLRCILLCIYKDNRDISTLLDLHNLFSTMSSWMNILALLCLLVTTLDAATIQPETVDNSTIQQDIADNTTIQQENPVDNSTIPQQNPSDNNSTTNDTTPSTETPSNYSNFKFSLDLLQKLAAKNENVVLSPFGASLAMGVLALAAQGNSLKEIYNAFNIKDEEEFESIRTEFKELIQSMKDGEGNTIDFATCIFTQSGCGILSIFGKKATDLYKSDIQQLDFKATRLAAHSINKWVKQHTENKIDKLVDENTLNSETQLMIVSAVYFHGLWQMPFNVTSTREKDFITLNGTKKVQMMRINSNFPQAYDSETNTRVLALPYANSNFSMIILLPRNNDGLPQLIKSLSPKVLNRMFDGLKNSDMFVDLPKFKLESDLSLKSTLMEMGINDVFTAKANITGVLCNQSLHVSDVMQKTFIEVDESGTTAASATGIELIPLFLPSSFTVDHPFVFLILDYETELILFSGAVYDFPDIVS